MTDYLKRPDIEAARAAGGDFVGISVKGVDLVIPSSFMEANGVGVRIVREPSALNEDGSLAQAGTSYHEVIQFERIEDAMILSRAIPYLPGCQTCAVWQQKDVDDACYLAINKRRIEDKRLSDVKGMRERVQAQRQQAVQDYAQPKRVRADKLRAKTRVVTLDDGKVWTVAAVSAYASVLVAYPNGDTQRVLQPDEDVLPFTEQTELQIKNLLAKLKLPS